MRITGGLHRSRHLVAPSGDLTRPTADRVREALFSILGPRVHDAIVLDLFAGTGALGLEALSRGAAHVLMVEKNPKALTAIRTNIEALRETERVELVRGDAMTHALAPAHFDILFVDPPYRLVDEPGFPNLLARLAAAMRPGAQCVVEHATRTVPPTPNHLELGETRTYGDTSLTFYSVAPQN